MVKTLSSQKYIKYTWFLKFTENKSEHPGLSHLSERKKSINWSSNIDNYKSLSFDEKEEFKKI